MTKVSIQTAGILIVSLGVAILVMGTTPFRACAEAESLEDMIRNPGGEVASSAAPGNLSQLRPSVWIKSELRPSDSGVADESAFVE